jgi:putative MATE family efflux protein
MSIIGFNKGELGPFMRDAWSLGWPMTTVMFCQFAVGLTDVYVAGRLSVEVMAAVGYVSQLYFTLVIIGNGLTVGTTAMVSQAFGARSPHAIWTITAHSLMMGTCVAGALTVAAQCGPHLIVKAAGMPSEIEGVAEKFLRVFSLVLAPTYVGLIAAGVLRASGRVRLAMINGLITASVNVAGDVILGFGWGPIPAMGFMGIAWSSAAATSLGMILNLLCLAAGHVGSPAEGCCTPITACFKNLLKMGLPAALQQAAWNAGTLVVYFLVGRIGHGQITALAAMTAGLRVEAIIFLPIFAFNMAAAVLTGNRLGAQDEAGARSGAKAAALLCTLCVAAPAAAIFIFAPEASRFLTNDPAVMEEMARYLRINMAAVPFMAVGMSLSGALQGAGDTLNTMKIIFSGMWLIRLPLIFCAIYVFDAGPTGVWWAMSISIVAMCAIFVIRFQGNRWPLAARDAKGKAMLWEACVPQPLPKP